eukprot:4755754-Pyramimonas_sp.AAC.1
MHHTAARQRDANFAARPAATDWISACCRAAAAGIGRRSPRGWVPEGCMPEGCLGCVPDDWWSRG